MSTLGARVVRLVALAGLAVGLLLRTVPAWSGDLEEVKAKGVLKVAVYNDFAPFHDKGKGIDVAIGEALANRLGVKLALLPFDADENVEDDLRNMVWKGHYLGYGPADVMMHAPVDAEFMKREDKVSFFAPYFRDALVVARNLSQIPALDSVQSLRGKPLGAETASASDTFLLSTESGALRNQVRHYKTTVLAVREGLLKGEVAAVMGPRSELEAGLGGASGFEVAALPGAGLRGEWVVGLSVKRGHEALSQGLQAAMNGLREDGTLARIFAEHGISYRAP